ncbi:MAG: hypothetical protein AAF675_01700 [Pseudomonadota bacterium]
MTGAPGGFSTFSPGSAFNVLRGALNGGLRGGIPEAPARLAAAALGLRNSVLDAGVYDLPGLTAAEIAALAPRPGTDDAGTILVVHPRDTRENGVIRHADYSAFRAAPGRQITRFAIAGLGSSALGAAALGRTLADATGKPVGVVVAGYGPGDLVSEAMGGFLLFAAANRMRHARATLGHRLGTLVAERQPGLPGPRPHDFATPDVAMLVRLLAEPGRRIHVLLGHSKGALALSAALARVLRTGDAETAARLARAQVITAGAVIAFPPEIAWVHQLIGTLDTLGQLNSQRGLPAHRVALAGHHLNTALPFHLDLGAELLRLLAPDDRPRGGATVIALNPV